MTILDDVAFKQALVYAACECGSEDEYGDNATARGLMSVLMNLFPADASGSDVATYIRGLRSICKTRSQLGAIDSLAERIDESDTTGSWRYWRSRSDDTWMPIETAPAEEGACFGPVLLRFGGNSPYRPAFYDLESKKQIEVPIVGMWDGRRWVSDACSAWSSDICGAGIEIKDIEPTLWAYIEPQADDELARAQTEKARLEKKLRGTSEWMNRLVTIPRKMPQSFDPVDVAGNIEHALDFSACSDEFTAGAKSAIGEIARYLSDNRQKIYDHYRKRVLDDIRNEKAWARKAKQKLDESGYSECARFSVAEWIKDGEMRIAAIAMKADPQSIVGTTVALDFEPYTVSEVRPLAGGKVGVVAEKVGGW